MIDVYPYIRPLLMAMDAEKAHGWALSFLRMGLGPAYQRHDDALAVKLFGRVFPNPLGLAAGFDKDAEVIAPLFKLGFGFVEVGTVTPLPQHGNDRPRIFRDIANESIINRMGFPGKGLETFTKNIAAFRQEYPQTSGILGVNIGVNKDTAIPLEDYKKCMEKVAAFADYITVNVSSPNTAGLRNLQAKEQLEHLLSGLLPEKTVPVLLKVAPDLDAEQRADIVDVFSCHRIDGLVVANTTLSRPAALAASLKEERGGLSGRLLTDLSTEIIRDFYRRTAGAIPIIGVGGVSSAEDAYRKIKAGASLVQLYTGLVYQGPGLITRILEGLTVLMQQDGFKHISEAVGCEKGTGKAGAKAVL